MRERRVVPQQHERAISRLRAALLSDNAICFRDAFVFVIDRKLSCRNQISDSKKHFPLSDTDSCYFLYSRTRCNDMAMTIIIFGVLKVTLSCGNVTVWMTMISPLRG